MDFARGCELLSDLKPGVATTDDEDAALGEVRWRAVGGAVELGNLGRELIRDRRHEPSLERPGRNDNLLRRVAAVLGFNAVGAVGPTDRANATVERDRQIEVLGVVRQVVYDVVAGRVAVRVAGKGKPGETAVANGRKELERVPALPPRRRGRGRSLEDHEVAPLLGEKVADRQAGLATTDNDHLALLGRAVIGRCL